MFQHHLPHTANASLDWHHGTADRRTVPSPTARTMCVHGEAATEEEMLARLDEVLEAWRRTRFGGVCLLGILRTVGWTLRTAYCGRRTSGPGQYEASACCGLRGTMQTMGPSGADVAGNRVQGWWRRERTGGAVMTPPWVVNAQRGPCAPLGRGHTRGTGAHGHGQDHRAAGQTTLSRARARLRLGTYLRRISDS